MKFYSETLGLSDTAFSLLRDLIHHRTGLFYENNKQEMLADKLSARVVECGFHSFLDYYYFLKYDPEAVAEWQRVMDALAVQETYFWREMDQVHALVEVLVPEYFAAGRREPLRIWSAACATGEEPLTIAMALHEAGWPALLLKSMAAMPARLPSRRRDAGCIASGRFEACRKSCEPAILPLRPMGGGLLAISTPGCGGP